MPSPLVISNLIPLGPLLALGTAEQASFVQGSGPIGATFLALEHCYAGVPWTEHAEATTRLGEMALLFKRKMTESSIAFLSTYVLTDYFQKSPLFVREGAEYPALLTDLLMGRQRHPRSSNRATAPLAAASHFGSLVGIDFRLARGTGGEIRLYDATQRVLMDFPSGKAEMQVSAEVEGSMPLLALVALHLHSLAAAASERDTAARLVIAAGQVYPG
ncbi:MAG TPA: hypothetical protein VLJ37_02245 [bacterium]|nr:hypothetical protein [bacterium]